MYLALPLFGAHFCSVWGDLSTSAERLSDWLLCHRCHKPLTTKAYTLKAFGALALLA